MSTEIIYKDSVIETLEAGDTTTLHTKDTTLTDDLIIKTAGGAGGTDSPLPIEVDTETEMNSLLETAEPGSVYKYTGSSGTYAHGALYVLEESK